METDAKQLKTSETNGGSRCVKRLVRCFSWYLAPLLSAGMTFAATTLAVRVMDDFGFALTALCFCSIWWPLMTGVTRLANSSNKEVSNDDRREELG